MAGLLLPTGIATNSFTQYFFADLIKKKQLVQMLGFENEGFIFPAVHHAFKFCVFVLAGTAVEVDETDFVFFCRDFEDIRQDSRHFKLSKQDFFLINPNTGTCPTFRTAADAELTKKVYRRVPVLVNERLDDDPWSFDNMLMFMMNTDSHLFESMSSSQAVPLYEAKMMYQFDHRYATYENATQSHLNSGILPKSSEEEKQNPNWLPKPQYWVNEDFVQEKLDDRWTRDWLLGFRDITSSVVERTSIFSLIPRTAVGNKIPLLLLAKGNAVLCSAFLANANSLTLDFIARQKIGGTSLNFYILKQFPFLKPDYYSRADLIFLIPRILELVFTAWNIAPFAADVWQEADETLQRVLRNQWQENKQATGGHTWDTRATDLGLETPPPFPPFKWDDERRACLRAELDAYYARLYGLTRDELRYILDPEDVYGPDFPGETFRVLKEKEIKEYGEYRTQRLVLAAWDEQQGLIDRGEMVVGGAGTGDGDGAGSVVAPEKGAGGTEDGAQAAASTAKAGATTSIREKKAAYTTPLPGIPLPDISAHLAQGFSKRLAHVNKISRNSSPAITAELAAFLDDPSESIRWMVGSVLANRGGMETVAALAAYLEQAEEGPGREEALKVLGQIGNQGEEEQVRKVVEELMSEFGG